MVVERNDFASRGDNFAHKSSLFYMAFFFLHFLFSRLIVERNDFASRGAEGMKQVRAMHIPEFEAEEQPTPSESEVVTPEAEKAKDDTAPEKYVLRIVRFHFFF
jgi:hypothetical protein